MSEKRRDNKGRILRNNESQRADGKYEYKYRDASGVRKSVYSWRLMETDKLPKGKRECASLRAIEQRLASAAMNGTSLSINRQSATLNEYFKLYMETKYWLRPTTHAVYKSDYDRYVREDMGARKISGITANDIRMFYIRLVDDVGLQLSTLANVYGLLHPVFEMAVRDSVIQVNPTDGVLSAVRKERMWEPNKRHALTIQQQNRLLDFVSSGKYGKWKPLITFLLGTGCRIGEAAALQWSDCDFDMRVIHINHSLGFYIDDNGRRKPRMYPPKTRAGKRSIPMFNDVYEVLAQRYEMRDNTRDDTPLIDSYNDFVFFSQNRNPIYNVLVNRALKTISARANDREEIASAQEHRKPILLPNFSCHSLRHTFCTRLCESGMNIKVIQDVMGHSDIQMTMSVYSEATLAQKVQSFSEIDGRIRLG